MIAQSRSLRALSLLALAIVIAGCGGGGSPLSGTFGNASFTVSWSGTRSDPFAESVKITITLDGTAVATQTVDRYQNEDRTTVNFDRLPAGALTANITVYPMADGGGTPTGQAIMPLALSGGGNASISLTTVISSVSRLEISPNTPEMAVSETLQLTATAFDGSNQVVLVPVDAIHWASSNTAIATVDANGLATGITAGKPDITATDTGSGKGAIIQVPVGYAKWTVLVYMAADNNLEEYAMLDMNEMESIGSDSKLKIAVEFDRTPGYDTSNGDWTDTRRYLITKDADVNIINSQLVQNLGELDMAAPQNLTDFIQWGMNKYPADRYLLVMWDHGRGWRTRTLAVPLTREVKSINVDDTSSTEMSLGALKQALEANLGPHPDVILFDACLMQMIEVAYSVRNYADVMVASEENIPVLGQPYGRLLSRITANPDISPSSLGEAIVDEYMDYYGTGYAGTFTFSAINLTALDQLVTATDAFAQSVITNLPAVQTGVRAAQEQAQRYDFDKNEYKAYKDLYDFARLVNANVSVADVQEKATSVMSAVETVVIHERNSGGVMANSHGISIYLPDPGTALSAYNLLDFSQDTHWDEMVAGY